MIPVALSCCMVKSSVMKLVTPPGFSGDEDYNKTYQRAGEHSCKVSGHLAYWGRLASIAMYAASVVMTYCWEDVLLDWSQQPVQRVSLMESMAMCPWLRWVLYKLEDILVWPGERWASPVLLAKGMLCMTEYHTGFQSRYVVGTGQVLIFAATL